MYHAALFFISATVIALQMGLMRALSVITYSHFTSFVISIALLGFGVSGTFLTFFRDRIGRHAEQWFLFFFTLFTFFIPTSYFLAQQLPLDIQYLFFSSTQVLVLVLYALLLFVPFFCGGVLIGLILSFFPAKVQSLYGANLLGSGAGGVASLLIMIIVPPLQLPYYTALGGIAALGLWIFQKQVRVVISPFFRFAAITIVAGAVLPWFFFASDISVDQYKSLSRFRDLQRQGDAAILASDFGPRATIDVFDSPVTHQTLFAGIQSETEPPQQLTMLIDGNTGGTVFKADDVSQTEIVTHTPQSVPYRLLKKPTVLLLGEVGGVNVWLAKRYGAASITVVQDNPKIIELMKNELREENGGIFLAENVKVVEQDPRHFLETAQGMYDIIHFAGPESIAAGSRGLHGIHENYLLTVEAFRSAMDKLTDRGMLSITRGMQTPPRDSLKLVATAVEAANSVTESEGGRNGGGDAAEQLLAGRNYLAFHLVVAKQELSSGTIGRFRAICRSLTMDAEYYPGIVSSEIEQINIIDGPEGKPYSYVHHGIKEIVKGEGDRFYARWIYNIGPSRDNSPYFSNFFTWRSFHRFLELFKQHGFNRMELGYLVLVTSFVVVTVIAFSLILVPLLRLRKKTATIAGKGFTVLYFGFIGLGFMFLEIVLIQTLTKLLGDPIFATGCVLTSILVFSGLGSTVQEKIDPNTGRRIGTAVVALILFGTVLLALDRTVLKKVYDASVPLRFLLASLSTAPLSFFLGWFFSSGVTLLRGEREQFIPLAWGVNGFASVAASPLAVILSLETGYIQVMVMAFGLYVGVGILGVVFARRIIR